jgi:methyl-accepting chemotaxis protein
VAVRRVTDIMGEISAASDEQSSGIEQVNQAVNQMDEVTQQNAALVEQAAAAALSLEEQAQLLRNAVATFRTDASAELAVAAPIAVAAPAVPGEARPHKTEVVPSIARALASRKAAKPAVLPEAAPEQVAGPAAAQGEKALHDAHAPIVPVAAAVVSAAASEAVVAPALKLTTGSADEDDWSTF